MYKVLFVCSGNKSDGMGPVVANQAQSLIDAGTQLDYFLVKGNGFSGYLKNIPKLLKTINRGKYDIIHAHGISALLTTLTFKRPIVVSLLGSELNESKVIKFLNHFLACYYWSHTIVKSNDMALKLNCKNLKRQSIIPNGVNLLAYYSADQLEARSVLKFDKQEHKIILWLADPDRKSKNFALAHQAISYMKMEKLKLLQVHNIPKDRVPYYINAADIVLLTSLWEGSPNIIKEAMACNRPIVSTNVGDVKWLFGNLPGHYITSFDPIDVSEKINLALQFSEINLSTNGRKRIVDLGLDSESIAKKITYIYKTLIESAN